MKLVEFTRNSYLTNSICARVNTDGYTNGKTYPILENEHYGTSSFRYGDVFGEYYTIEQSINNGFSDFTVDTSMHGKVFKVVDVYYGRVKIAISENTSMNYPASLLDVVINDEDVVSPIYGFETLPAGTAVLVSMGDPEGLRGSEKQEYIKIDDIKPRREFHNRFFYCNHCNLIFCKNDPRQCVQVNRGLGNVLVCNMGNVLVCNNCHDDLYSTCEECGGEYHIHNLNSGMCGNCEIERHSIACRNFGKPIISSELGEVKSQRTFGVEIECDLGECVSSDIPKACGIVEDGSIDGDNAYELVTPPLGGKDGEKWLADLSSVLNKNGVSINKSCGLHVHLIAEDFKGSYTKLRNLVLFYYSLQDVMFSMVPYSRRNNNYCRKIESVINMQAVKGVYSLESFEKAFYGTNNLRDIEHAKGGKYCDKRYAFLNIHNLFYTGKTIEIRNHSGTIQSSKILPWVNLHALILDYVSNSNTVTINRAIKKLNNMKLSEKTNLMFKLIGISKEHADYLLDRQAKFTPEMIDPFNVTKRGASDDDDGIEVYSGVVQ